MQGIELLAKVIQNGFHLALNRGVLRFGIGGIGRHSKPGGALHFEQRVGGLGQGRHPQAEFFIVHLGTRIEPVQRQFDFDLVRVAVAGLVLARGVALDQLAADGEVLAAIRALGVELEFAFELGVFAGPFFDFGIKVQRGAAHHLHGAGCAGRARGACGARRTGGCGTERFSVA